MTIVEGQSSEGDADFILSKRRALETLDVRLVEIGVFVSKKCFDEECEKEGGFCVSVVTSAVEKLYGYGAGIVEVLLVVELLLMDLEGDVGRTDCRSPPEVSCAWSRSDIVVLSMAVNVEFPNALSLLGTQEPVATQTVSII